jgi:hypothetical protein
MMWLLGANQPVETDGTEARSTLTYVDDETPPVLKEAPEWNETETDNQPHSGLDPTTAIGPTHDGVQYVVATPYRDLAHADYNRVVDEQVATSGTAAQREAEGQWGHGTAQYTESLQPVIRDGGTLGNEVFLRSSRPVQEGMASSMTPDAVDPSWQAVAQRVGTRNGRVAFNATILGADPWRDA